MARIFGLFLLLVFCMVQRGSAIKCYTCSVTEEDLDQTCITNPEKGTVTNCNKVYCTSQRQEYKDPKDKVASMSRSCDDKPLYMNEIVEDEDWRIYYIACTKDLCNGGSGKAGGGDSEPGSLGDKSTIYCPGIGDNNPSAIPTTSFTYILLGIISNIFFIFN